MDLPTAVAACALAVLFLLGLIPHPVLRAVVPIGRPEGQNFGSTVCPRCSRRRPWVRVPLSLRQAVRGGWTCGRCRTELDEWGRKVREHSAT